MTVSAAKLSFGRDAVSVFSGSKAGLASQVESQVPHIIAVPTRKEGRTVDEWEYAEILRAASLRTLYRFEQALRGVDSQEHSKPAPYRLEHAQLKEVRAHLAGISRVLDDLQLEPVPVAKAQSAAHCER